MNVWFRFFSSCLFLFHFSVLFTNSHGKAAVAIIITFLLTSWIVSALVSLKFNYTHKVAEPLESFGYLYEKPWTRLGPYVMGTSIFYSKLVKLCVYHIEWICLSWKPCKKWPCFSSLSVVSMIWSDFSMWKLCFV